MTALPLIQQPVLPIIIITHRANRSLYRKLVVRKNKFCHRLIRNTDARIVFTESLKEQTYRQSRRHDQNVSATCLSPFLCDRR